jgi:hypothetical protein
MVNVKDLKKGNYYILEMVASSVILKYDKNISNTGNTILNYNYRFKIIAVKINQNNHYDFRTNILIIHLCKKDIRKIKPIDKNQVKLLRI